MGVILFLLGAFYVLMFLCVYVDDAQLKADNRWNNSKWNNNRWKNDYARSTKTYTDYTINKDIQKTMKCNPTEGPLKPLEYKPSDIDADETKPWVEEENQEEQETRSDDEFTEFLKKIARQS